MENSELNYKSPIDGRMTTAHQYITEIICKRIAKKDKRGEITSKFWNQETWKTTYRYQIIQARSLLKLYSVEAIIKGLNACPYCYSLGAKFLDEKIKIEEEKIERIKKNREEQNAEKAIKAELGEVKIDIQENKVPRKLFQDEKSQMKKLRDL